MLIVQGEDATIEVVAKVGSVLYDLTGVKAFFTVKKNWKDRTALIAKMTTNAGGSDSQILVLPQIGLTKGKLQIYVAAADTAVLTDDEIDSSRDYVYDIWLITVAGNHKVVRRMCGFQIAPRVTILP